MNRQLFHNMVAQYDTKTVTGTASVEWSGGAHCYLPSIKFYGKSKLGGTPSPEAPVGTTDFAGYFSGDGNSRIVIPTLRSVGTIGTGGVFRDEWDYVTGKGLRIVKEIILDGETNKVSSATSKSGRIAVSEACVRTGAAAVWSTHFAPGWNTNHGSIYMFDLNIVAVSMNGGLSVDEWNAWLKAQYDAGTPVKIYYVLKEPQQFEERPSAYIPIPNDSGRVAFESGTFSDVPFDVTYITHS